MLQSVLANTALDEDMVDENLESQAVSKILETAEKSKKAGIMKQKVKSIARMRWMFKTLKDENESLLKIKGMAPDGKIPRGLLLDGRPAIKDKLREFSNAKKLDSINERYPKAKK